MPRTGPRTEEGKAIVSRNAMKHGLYGAPGVVVGDEQPGEWEAFHQDIVDDRNPEGPLETALASRVALLLWRLRRLHRAEAEAIQARIDHFHAVVEYERWTARLRRRRLREAGHPVGPEDEEEESTEQLKARAEQLIESAGFYATPPSPEEIEPAPLLPHSNDHTRFLQAEAHLNRQLTQTLHELEALQARRHGAAAPLARVSFAGLPGV
jgi:hypothetical protein